MSEIVPIFPLNIVLLPRMPLPLHIFEERYKKLIADCESNGKQFGVVPMMGTRMCNSGCLAEIERIIQRYEDGRSDILTFGTQRFTIQHIHHAREYLEAEIEHYTDTPPAAEEDVESLVTRGREVLLQFAETLGQTINQKALTRIGAEDLSFLLGSTEVFNHRDKHAFLQMRSSTQRLRNVLPVLEESIRTRHSRRNLKKMLGDSVDLDNLFN